MKKIAVRLHDLCIKKLKRLYEKYKCLAGFQKERRLQIS